MRAKHILAVTACLFLAGQVLAQSPYRETKSPTTSDHLNNRVEMKSGVSGLLDPSRFSMSHQIGMGYSSFGGHGYSQGYYMNTLSYKFNAPVMLRLRTGVTNNPFSSGNGNMSQPGQPAMAALFNEAEFFGGADFLWKPRENVRFMISVNKSAPGAYYGAPYGYGGPYGMTRDSYGMGVFPYSSFARNGEFDF